MSGRMRLAAVAAALTISVLATQDVSGQGRGRGGGPPPAPRAGAPVDLTGNWVAVITEDWMWRMRTPPKLADGRADVTSVPLNAEGRKVADAWDPANDGKCEAYGVGGLMRMPTRLRISWENDTTLKIESDAGVMSGFFVIKAASREEAIAIAKTCPHLRHGGRVAVRPVPSGV